MAERRVGGDFKNISIEDIVSDGVNVRKKETDITDLAQSIKEHGVLEPIIVRPKGNKFEIVAGSRRVKASKFAGEKTIPAVIRELSDEEAELISYTENAQRNDLDIEDEGPYLVKLYQKFGKNYSKVAEYISRMGQKRRYDYVEDRLNEYWSLQRYKAISAMNSRNSVAESGQIPEVDSLSRQQHALLESAISTVKQSQGWSEEETNRKYMELMKSLSSDSVDIDMTRKILNEFKKYPENPINQTVSIATNLVDYSGKIPTTTMREVEELAKEKRVSVDNTVHELLKKGIQYDTMVQKPSEKQTIFTLSPEEADEFRKNYEEIQTQTKDWVSSPEGTKRRQLFENMTYHERFISLSKVISCPVCGSHDAGWLCHHIDSEDAYKKAKEQYQTDLKKVKGDGSI